MCMCVLACLCVYMYVSMWVHVCVYVEVRKKVCRCRLSLSTYGSQGSNANHEVWQQEPFPSFLNVREYQGLGKIRETSCSWPQWVGRGWGWGNVRFWDNSVRLLLLIYTRLSYKVPGMSPIWDRLSRRMLRPAADTIWSTDDSEQMLSVITPALRA